MPFVISYVYEMHHDITYCWHLIYRNRILFTNNLWTNSQVGTSQSLSECQHNVKLQCDNDNRKSHKHVCITTNQPYIKSIPIPNPHPNPTSKQHATVNIKLIYSHISYVSREIYTRQCCCTVCTNFGCHYHTTASLNCMFFCTSCILYYWVSEMYTCNYLPARQRDAGLQCNFTQNIFSLLVGERVKVVVV